LPRHWAAWRTADPQWHERADPLQRRLARLVDFGSATAPMYEAQSLGKKFQVYCDETRPRSQGATLTAWELAQQKISHQVIADNAAGHLMQRGKIDLVIVGSDRTLGRTGEVATRSAPIPKPSWHIAMAFLSTSPSRFPRSIGR